MKNILAFLFILVFCIVSAQETQKPIDSIQKVKVQVVDSITITNSGTELPEIVSISSTKDSLVFALKDLETARKIDSAWLKELYSSNRFEEMYGTILNEDYKPEPYKELSTTLLKQRLKELDARTPFTVEYNPSLESVINRYLKNRRRTMANLMALADYYFPMFEEELARQGLPLEMKYLAIVESALDPRAESRVGATGLWQFMFPTGKMFGLDVNSYVDERSDPNMATVAAAKYLNSLYNSLGDWDLALAAYNSGPGNVAKAIRRSGGRTNYWNIRTNLPRETAGYVPAFLATMYIFEFADEHGFKSAGPQIPYIATDTVKIKKQASLQQIADIANLDLEEVRFLNPSYKLDIIPVVKDENYMLRLPLDGLGKFLANEEAIYAYAEAEFNKREKPLPDVFDQSDRIRYRVKSGDYLGKIASKYGVSVSQIKRWNSLRSNNLKIGQRLTIHPKRTASRKSSNKNIASSGKNLKTYTVKSGDSLWSISQKFPGVTVKNLKTWNDISGSKLKPGMKIKIQKG